MPAVLDQAGMVFESESDADEPAQEARTPAAEVIDESKLGVFKDFIETASTRGLDTGCVKNIQPPPFFVDFSGPRP